MIYAWMMDLLDISELSPDSLPDEYISAYYWKSKLGKNIVSRIVRYFIGME